MLGKSRELKLKNIPVKDQISYRRQTFSKDMFIAPTGYEPACIFTARPDLENPTPHIGNLNLVNSLEKLTASGEKFRGGQPHFCQFWKKQPEWA